jgi:hypothetical protein
MGSDNFATSEIQVDTLVRDGGVISTLHHGAIAVANKDFSPVLVDGFFQGNKSLCAHLISKEIGPED